MLEILHQRMDGSETKKTKAVETLLARIQQLCDDAVSTRLKADEGWAGLLRQDLSGMKKSQRERWERLLSIASSVSPEPPATDWDVSFEENPILGVDEEVYWTEHDRLFFARCPATEWKKSIEKHIASIGATDFESHRLKWFQAVPDSKPGTLSRFSANREILRGLLWTCEHSDNSELTRAIRIAAAFFFQKNSPLGRTSVRLLAHFESSNVLEELTHLRNQVRSQSQVRLIDTARALVADSHRRYGK